MQIVNQLKKAFKIGEVEILPSEAIIYDNPIVVTDFSEYSKTIIRDTVILVRDVDMTDDELDVGYKYLVEKEVKKEVKTLIELVDDFNTSQKPKAFNTYIKNAIDNNLLSDIKNYDVGAIMEFFEVSREQTTATRIEAFKKSFINDEEE